MEWMALIGTAAIFFLTVLFVARLLLARTERLDKRWERRTTESLPADKRPVQLRFSSIDANDPS